MGFWQRGDPETTPLDHFSDCNNVEYTESGVQTRDGLNTFYGQGNLVRIYTYNITLGQGFLALDSNGDFYHILPNVPSSTLILHIANCTDFKYQAINNRAFITPIIVTAEFLYVYNGDLTPARKAGGVAPKDADGALAAANSGSAGHVEAGIHVFGVVYETDSGYLTKIGPDTLPFVTAPGAQSVNLTNIPVSPSGFVIARRIVATRFIDPAVWAAAPNTRGYNFYFVPGGEITNNTATTLTVSFFDGELLDDASHLLDLVAEIPAGNGLEVYHNRMVLYAPNSDGGLIGISYPGEPEAISLLDGLIPIQARGMAILNARVYRDVLYIFQINKTFAIQDNGDVPSSWDVTVIDEGIGAGLHGTCTVNNDEGGTNVETLVTFDFNGIFFFNGLFQRPELSWKVKDFWLGLTRSELETECEIYNDVLHQRLYVNIPSLFMIFMGDYSNGFDPKNIKWTKWTFDIEPTTISLFSTDEKLIIGSLQLAP